jgi:hypothetical protein
MKNKKNITKKHSKKLPFRDAKTGRFIKLEWTTTTNVSPKDGIAWYKIDESAIIPGSVTIYSNQFIRISQENLKIFSLGMN